MWGSFFCSSNMYIYIYIYNVFELHDRVSRNLAWTTTNTTTTTMMMMIQIIIIIIIIVCNVLSLPPSLPGPRLGAAAPIVPLTRILFRESAARQPGLYIKTTTTTAMIMIVIVIIIIIIMTIITLIVILALCIIYI